mmetsp:Transcript_93580/g.202369  ORF Transcript_93580/g.202369 Transcript_93580/m.202369 type:complete len:259 (+) Transcript_93580:120-896(+)
MLSGLAGKVGLGGSSEAEKAAPAAGVAGEEKKQNWEVNLGPLSFGSKGVELKPQLLVSVDAANFAVEAGIHDVRDGLKVSAGAEVRVTAKAEGASIPELHKNIKCETPGFREALEKSKDIMDFGGSKASAACKQIAKMLGIPEARLQKIMDGKTTGGGPMKLGVKVATGVGAGAEVRLGWEDTQGYHMVGVGGEAKAAVNVGANLFAGKHKDGTSIKVIVGVGNFTFEYVLPTSKQDAAEEPDSTYTGGVAPEADLLG